MPNSFKYIEQIVSRLMADGEISAKEAPGLLTRLNDSPSSLVKYITDAKTANEVSNFGGMRLVQEGVAKPRGINEGFYTPAIRVSGDNILYDKNAKYHGEVLGNHLKDIIDSGDTLPSSLKREYVKGTGGIGPDGSYYESDMIGDVFDLPPYIQKIVDKIELNNGTINAKSKNFIEYDAILQDQKANRNFSIALDFKKIIDGINKQGTYYAKTKQHILDDHNNRMKEYLDKAERAKAEAERIRKILGI